MFKHKIIRNPKLDTMIHLESILGWVGLLSKNSSSLSTNFDFNKTTNILGTIIDL